MHLEERLADLTSRIAAIRERNRSTKMASFVIEVENALSVTAGVIAESHLTLGQLDQTMRQFEGGGPLATIIEKSE